MPPLKLTALTSVNPAASYLVMATTAPGDPDRLFLVSVWGHIYIYNLATQTLNPEPFLNLLGSISFTGERGVLGLAFHPDYQANGRFFVHYSALNTGATQVTEFVRSTPDAAALNPVASVLSEPQPFANHNGGTLTFGPDGLLYLFLGDGGSAGDPFGNGQSLATRLGKVIRLDVDAGGVTAAGGYPGALPEVWAAGLRNPWRAAFDPCTDNLYIADVGQNQWEEVNVVRPTDVGRNFGWDTMEGSQCHEPATGCNTAGLTLPVYEYSHNGSAASITGGYVYRGNNIPAARGRYFFADWSTGMVRSFRFEAGQAMDVLDHGAEIGLNAPGFGQDADGELYVTDGTTLYRIDPDI